MPTERDIVTEARELLNQLTTGRRIRECELPELLSQARVSLRLLADECERLRRQVKQMVRDAREDALDAAAEARWQERQGEDYGTY